MDNLAVRLRKLRSDCESGGYTIENNGVWTNDNRAFLRDVLTALNDATRTINELLSADEVSDDALTELLWDSKVEQQLSEYRRMKLQATM